MHLEILRGGKDKTLWVVKYEEKLKKPFTY